MNLSSEIWTYLLVAFVFGALIGLFVQAYLRRGLRQNELRALREQADTEVAALRSRLADIDGQRMQAVDRLTGLDAQFETLRTSSERALEAFAERIRDLEANLHGRESQVRTAEARCSAEAHAHAQTRAKFLQVAEAMQTLQGAHAAVVADRERLEQELIALRDEVVGARGLVHEIDAAGRGREAALEAEIADLQDRLGEARVRLTATQQGERALKAELEDQLRQRNERDAERQTVLDELGGTRAALEQSAVQLADSRLELDRLREALAAVQAAAEAAEDRARRLGEQAESRAMQAREANSLRAQLAEADALATAARERAESMEMSAGDLRAQMATLEARHRDAEAAARQLREELQQARLQQASASGESASLKMALEASQEALSAQRLRGQATDAELADLRRQLVELSAKMKTAGGDEQRLRDELQRLTQQQAASTEELARLRREVDEARNSLRIAKSREETLLAEVGEMRARANAERAAAERLAAEINSMQASPAPASKREFRPSVVASMEAAQLEELVVAAGEGRQPAGSVDGHAGDFDDLKRIGGVGPVNEKWLHDQGIFYFWQIAGWEPAEVAWVAQHLPNFGARVYRENWVAQATQLARGEATGGARKHGQGKQR